VYTYVNGKLNLFKLFQEWGGGDKEEWWSG
jgi:hypothetical protein